MDKNKPIEFLRKKDYKFIKEIGQGGTGRTVLLKDEIIDELFVCKKYSPYNESDKALYFKNFVDEIKIMHLLYHRNLVRVFNYYLYPDKGTGFILMEYIQGSNIEKYLSVNPDKINTVFTQTIEGFAYLEQNNILHRDIRPLNILVSENAIVKIIDFGFGKRIEFDDPFNKSISLNWLYTLPDEFENKIYDFKTEMYFVGKLFEAIIVKNKIDSFQYNSILKKMIVDYYSRFNSFFDVSREITEGSSLYNEFDDYEKGIYRRFVGELIPLYASMDGTQRYVLDIDKITSDLENIHRSQMLEDTIQNIGELIGIFVSGGCSYWTKLEVSVEVVKEFANWFRQLPLDKQKIVLTHIWKRLDGVKREIKKSSDDDLPF
jgi:serine/threonine protein kinase